MTTINNNIIRSIPLGFPSVEITPKLSTGKSDVICKIATAILTGLAYYFTATALGLASPVVLGCGMAAVFYIRDILSLLAGFLPENRR